MSNFISFFAFCQGHPKRMMLSGGRCTNRNTFGTGNLTNRPNFLTNFDAKGEGIDDEVDKETLTVHDGEASLKKLKEEEMSREQCLVKHNNASELENILPDSELVCYLPKKYRKAEQTCQRTCQLTFHGWEDASGVGHQQASYPNSADKSLTKLKSPALMEAFCNHIQCNTNRYGSNIQNGACCLKHNQLRLIQMREVAEAFVNQKFIYALKILNSNKELFLELLQDPNSLLVKHIQELRDSQAEKDSTQSYFETKLSQGTTNARQHGEPVCRRKNMPKFFWKKIKFLDRCPSKGGGNPQPFNGRIVSKPCPTSVQNFKTITSHSSSPHCQYSLQIKGKSFKTAYFSFQNIKKKLKNATGESRKEQNCISMAGTLHKFPCDIQVSKDGVEGNGVELARRQLPSGTFSAIQRSAKSPDVKRSNKVHRPKDIEQSIGNEVTSTNESGHENLTLSTAMYADRRKSKRCIEAKKHLSRMLRNGTEYLDFSRKQASPNLGQILSLPEYNFSPMVSSRKDLKHGFVNAQRRFSPYSSFYRAIESSWQIQEEKKTSFPSPLRQNEKTSCADDKKLYNHSHSIDLKPVMSENHFPNTAQHESISLIREEPTGATQSIAAKICKENGFTECSRLDSSVKNQSPTSSIVLSSSSLTSIQKAEHLHHIKHKAEQTSPVCFLEPFSMEDVTSPTSTISQPGEPSMQPFHINLEEHSSSTPVISHSDPEIDFITCVKEQASTSEYVSSALQAYGLNWDELTVMWHSSGQLLNPSLLDKMDRLLPQSQVGGKLLFDCINEVLQEVHQYYLGFSPWASLIESKIQPILMDKIFVHKVRKVVDRRLQQQPPYTSDELLANEMAKPGTWIDVRTCTEEIVIGLVEATVEELILETIAEVQI